MAQKSDAFVVGYAACERVFFGGAPVDGDTGPCLDPDFDATKVVNPFVLGSDQWSGFEEAYYDFTQK